MRIVAYNHMQCIRIRMYNDPHHTSTLGNVRLIDVHQAAFSGEVGDSPIYCVSNALPRQLPFQVRRVFYIYGTPEGSSRGGHSHYESYELIVAVKGRFRVELFDGREKRSWELAHPSRGLLIPPGLWREMHDFTADAVCLVLSSVDYSEADYVRSFDDFKALTGNE